MEDRANGICRSCSKVCDGTEDVFWIRREGVAGKAEVVDLEEESKRWMEINRKLDGKWRVCERCGKECKNKRGLGTHARSCKGEREERFIRKRILMETRPCLEV